MKNVKNCMSKHVFSCGPEASLPEVAHIMWDKDCGFVPVMDPESKQLMGVITDRDICMAAYTQGRPIGEIETREVMTGRTRTCHDGDDVNKAQDLMRKHQIRRLPVLDSADRLVGILSLNDLALQACDENDKKAQQDVAFTLGEVSRHRLPMAMPTGSAT